MGELDQQFPVRVLQVLGLPAGSVPLTSVSHDTTLSGSGTAGSPLAVIGAGSGGRAPATYTGPTLRSGANSAQPLCVSSTGGVVALPTASMVAGDVVVLFLQKDTGSISGPTGSTHLDSHSYSNGQSEIWSYVWDGIAATITFTNAGHNIWDTFGCVVAAGSRGSPALVDQHGLDAATGVQDWCYTQNPKLTPTQPMNLRLYFTVQVAAASAAGNNTLLPPGPLWADDTSNYLLFPVGMNFSLTGGGAGIFAIYSLDVTADPGVVFSYLGVNGGAGNQETGSVVLY